MYEWYQIALVVGAVITLVIAWEVPRAALWIALGGLSFVASSLWHDAGFPYGAAFGAATNFVVWLFIFSWARQQWEMRVINCFQAMIATDIVYFGLQLYSTHPSHYAFATLLELWNWLALVVIASTAIMEPTYGRLPVLRNGRWFRVFEPVLFAERQHPAFWKAP